MSTDDDEIEALMSWHMDGEEIAEFDKDLTRHEEAMTPGNNGSVARIVKRARRLLNLYSQDRAYRALLAQYEANKEKVAELTERIEKAKAVVGTPLSDDEPGTWASIYYILDGKR